MQCFRMSASSLMDESGQTFPVREIQVLVKYLSSGSGDAASQFGTSREGQLREEASRHLAFLAHELRTPLSSARLALSVLRTKGLKLNDGPSGGVLERSHVKLGTLIDESLVGARLDAGAHADVIQLELQPFLDQACDESDAEASVRQIQLLRSLMPDLWVQGRSPVAPLRRLEPGAQRSEVHARRRASTAAYKTIDGFHCIEIEDECGGLRAGFETQLFHAFSQFGEDRSGFGLGLAIAKQAIEAQGGSIAVRDLPGKGCVFSLKLVKASGRRA